MSIKLDLPVSVHWEKGKLYFLDQSKLPLAEVIDQQVTVEQVWDSIKTLKVRGAPALGVAGAYGMLVGLAPCLGLAPEPFIKKVEQVGLYLDASRPTAVNLGWAVRRMIKKSKALCHMSTKEIYLSLEEEAIQIHQEDIQCAYKIAEVGHNLIQDGMGILTHCNAGHLAVSQLGTALAPMYKAHFEGKKFRVYADETRPLLQGARLTAWELQQAGLDVTLICDNMVASMMSQQLIDLVIVGADRIAANGDAANKIGTLGVAILAQHFGVPFYVAAPFSTFDVSTSSGSGIEIEERDPAEVLQFGGQQIGPEGVKVRNPAFDVTDASLIHGFITDQGLIQPPYPAQLLSLFGAMDSL